MSRTILDNREKYSCTYVSKSVNVAEPPGADLICDVEMKFDLEIFQHESYKPFDTGYTVTRLKNCKLIPRNKELSSSAEISTNTPNASNNKKGWFW